ncbi:YciI family protein [Brevibacillus sp. SYSU BS000544]|uniref:YciI family protein n=1 Tax=Brevibacillus sp. SYSU BS000544 TaxID=3416443 RepID=UPI003CE47144
MTQQPDSFVRYVILLNMNEGKSLNEQLIREHVAYLRDLDQKGQLVLCGPFSNYRGGMVIISASSLEEATEIAERDPFVSSGAESYELRVWSLSCEENNHLGMG